MGTFTDASFSAYKAPRPPQYALDAMDPLSISILEQSYPQYILVNISGVLAELKAVCMGCDVIDIIGLARLSCAVYCSPGDEFYSLVDETLDPMAYQSLTTGLSASGYSVAGESTQDTVNRLVDEIVIKASSLSKDIDSFLYAMQCPYIEGLGCLYDAERIDPHGNLLFKKRDIRDF